MNYLPTIPIQQRLLNGPGNGHRKDNDTNDLLIENVSTSLTERIFLFILAAVYPFESYFPPVAGYGIVSVVFFITLFYLIMNRQHYLTRVIGHPALIAAYGVVVVGFIMESIQQQSDYKNVIRIANMVGGAVVIAALCRDRKSFMAVIYGYMLSSISMGVLAFVSSYFKLDLAVAANFNEASRIRMQVMSESLVEGNANQIAYIIAQGAVFSIALALIVKNSLHRTIWLLIALFAMVAATLPMSRSGIAIMTVELVALFFLYRGNFQKGIIFAAIAAFVVITFVPDIVFTRLQFDIDNKKDSRARIINGVISNYDLFVLYGVGTVGFWSSEINNKLIGSTKIEGAHNCYFAIWIYWGLPGIISWLIMIIVSARHIPPPWWNKKQRMLIWIMGLGCILMMTITHRLSAKEFAIGIGLITGTDYWMVGGVRRAMAATRFARLRPAQAPAPVIRGSV